MIHKTSIIDSKAKISNSVSIGPYAIIGPNVIIEDEVTIYSHVNIVGNTKIFNAGKYYIKVFNKANKGNYVLALGDIEKFTPLVIAKTIVTLPRINSKFWDKKSNFWV